jgi:hypothetical protein
LALFQANEAHSANSHSWLTVVALPPSIFLPQYNVTMATFAVIVIVVVLSESSIQIQKLGEKQEKKEERRKKRPNIH